MATVMQQALNDPPRAPEELLSLQARQDRLLALVAELLESNERLRMKVAQLEAQKESERGAR
jgi:hypothetical protein